MKTKNTGIIHQGDVMLIPLKEFKVGNGKKLPAATRGTVLAEGEATGHAHTFTPEVPAVIYDMGDGVRVLRLRKDAPLRHEEHGFLDVPRGDYEIRTPVEYEPGAVPRSVVD